MIKVVGVRFRTAGKIYFFDPLQFEIKRGDHVIVETARGIEFGTVVSGVTEVEDEKVIQPLKAVLRIASHRDVEQEASNKEKEREAFKICLEKIRKHELDMKLIDVEYTFDNNKVLFYFTADGRIDFRELVKDLASVFKTRIELRQIGVRDETKIRGGIGICGRPLCCHSYLADFVPVSIKMAKEQNLSLNPTKISGVCGRLMCCLKNEEETYEELNRRLPNIGDAVTCEDGLKGEVQSVNVLRQLVKVLVENGDEKEIKEYPVDKLQFRRRGGKREKVELSKEELQELERLENEEKEAEGIKSEEGRRQGGKNRQDNGQNRERGSHRENNRNQEGRNRNQQEGNNHREGQNRSDNAARRDEKHTQDIIRASETETTAGEGNQQSARPEGKKRQDNRNRRNNHNRQNENRQDRNNGGDMPERADNRQTHENGGNQGEKHRYDNRYHGRNRFDKRNRQEGQSNSNDNQA